MQDDYWLRVRGRTVPAYDPLSCHSGCVPPSRLQWEEINHFLLLVGYGEARLDNATVKCAAPPCELPTPPALLLPSPPCTRCAGSPPWPSPRRPCPSAPHLSRYWTVANPAWGSSWGENGFARIVRGRRELATSTIAVAADPMV